MLEFVKYCRLKGRTGAQASGQKDTRADGGMGDQIDATLLCNCAYPHEIGDPFVSHFGLHDRNIALIHTVEHV